MGVHNFYPSKWFAMIIFPLLGVGLVAGLYFLYKRDVDSGKPSTTLALQGADESIRKNVAEADRDKDGLPDWEETLWHSNPDNPDSDGDGTKDGDEVKQNRDPTVPGPNDRLDRLDAKTQNELTSGTSTDSTTLGATESMARELFGSYLLLKQTGKLDTTSKARLIQSLSDSVSKQIVLTPYTSADLTVVDATSKNIATYDKQMADIFTTFVNLGKTKNNEIVLLKQALETKDYSRLSEITADADIYNSMSVQLRKIPVPRDIAVDHLTLANGFQVYADMDRAMGDAQRDPIKAIAYIGRYQDIEKSGQQAMTRIVAYISAHQKTN